MIKANELRIGNWVNVNNKRMKVQSINSDGVNQQIEDGYYGSWHEKYEGNFHDWHKNGSDVVMPIQLSLELLGKCGFSKDDGDSQAWERQGIALIGSTDFDDGRFIVVGLSYWVGEEQHCCYVHSLHQLQNLYFALTGSEIEVNL